MREAQQAKGTQSFHVGDFVYDTVYKAYGIVKETKGDTAIVDLTRTQYGALCGVTDRKVLFAYLKDGNACIEKEINKLKRKIHDQENIKAEIMAISKEGSIMSEAKKLLEELNSVLKEDEQLNINEENIIDLVQKAKPALLEISQKAGDITRQFDGTEIYEVARVIQLTIQNYLDGLGDKIFKNNSQYAQAMGRLDDEV